MEIVATLVRHPYNLRRCEIWDLDDFWLRHVYFHAIDPKSVGDPIERVKVRAKTKAKRVSRRDEWLEHGRRWGWPDWYSLHRWEEETAAGKAAKAAKDAAKQSVGGKKRRQPAQITQITRTPKQRKQR